jgi:hypothetical protein
MNHLYLNGLGAAYVPSLVTKWVAALAATFGSLRRPRKIDDEMYERVTS